MNVEFNGNSTALGGGIYNGASSLLLTKEKFILVQQMSFVSKAKHQIFYVPKVLATGTITLRHNGLFLILRWRSYNSICSGFNVVFYYYWFVTAIFPI